MVVLFLLILLQISISSYANIEGDALYALRRAVKDPTNVLQSWDPTLVDPCTWFHVTCDSENRVTRLDLGNAKLSGNLVPELGKLERLQYLELYMNNFVGSIPSELGGLKNLISLDLFHNNLSGFIPPSLSKLSNVRFMRLSHNKLTGKIPRGLTKLHNLKIMDVSNNDLCGTFPTWGSFSKLTEERHPNICHNTGVIRMDKLTDDGWSSALGFKGALFELWVLLADPDISNSLCGNIMRHYRTSRASFFTKAQQYTQQYAMQRDPPPHLSTMASRPRMTRAPRSLDDFLL